MPVDFPKLVGVTVKGLKGVFECKKKLNVPPGTNVIEFTPVGEGKLYNITDLAVVNRITPFTYMWWLSKGDSCPIASEHQAQTASFWSCKPVDLWLNHGEFLKVDVYGCLEGDNIYASINGSERGI